MGVFDERKKSPNPLWQRGPEPTPMAKENIQTEIDASYLYGRLAMRADDPTVAEVYREMSDIEMGHARAFARHNGLNEASLPAPSVRARILDMIGRIFSDDYVLGVLMDTEKSLAGAVVNAKRAGGIAESGGEGNHVAIVRALSERKRGMTGAEVAKFETRHRVIGGNALRAAVLGGNDGLVSNFSLVMGIAGAAQGRTTVLLAGVAGLLAGALSMALGEWISVKSSQELHERQMAIEKEELETDPAGEERELALIYVAKGIPEEQAKALAGDIMRDKHRAYEILVKEELGIDVKGLKDSAWEAAVYSFVLFATGAIVPVLPFILLDGQVAIVASTVASGIGLFVIGAAITLFTGRNVWFSGLRQMAFGLIAAAITYAIGSVLGVSIAG